MLTRYEDLRVSVEIKLRYEMFTISPQVPQQEDQEKEQICKRSKKLGKRMGDRQPDTSDEI
jgi:hypothetical protein